MSDGICCAICSQVNRQKNGDLLHKIIGDKYNYKPRIILETENFVVFPSIGPLKLGHVILCTKHHYPSFACLPLSFEKEYRSISIVLSKLLEGTFGEKVHLFEHGSDINRTRIPCSVEHAHQHFIPSNKSIANNISNNFDWQVISLNITNLKQITKGQEYLLYKNTKELAIIALTSEIGFESQYFRKIFCDVLGQQNKWNWREHTKPLDVEKTFNTLYDSALLIKNLNPKKNSIYSQKA